MARIVMLDQDGSLQHLLHAVLEEAGYHVVETHNSYEGLQYDQATRTAVPTSGYRLSGCFLSLSKASGASRGRWVHGTDSGG